MPLMDRDAVQWTSAEEPSFVPAAQVCHLLWGIRQYVAFDDAVWLPKQACQTMCETRQEAKLTVVGIDPSNTVAEVGTIDRCSNWGRTGFRIWQKHARKVREIHGQQVGVITYSHFDMTRSREGLWGRLLLCGLDNGLSWSQ